MWEYPLDRPLYEFESERLTSFLMKCIGTPYGKLEAFRSGGIALSWVESLLHPEDLHEIFCSELVMKAYAEVGLH